MTTSADNQRQPQTPSAPLDPYWGLRLSSGLTMQERMFLRDFLPPEHAEGSNRFAAGALKQRGPGDYNKALQFRTLVKAYLKRLHLPVEVVVEQLFEDLMRASRAGDVGATKVLLDRLCGKDPDQLDVTVEVATLPEEERIRRLQQLLATAARRRIHVETGGLLPAPDAGGTLPG